MKGVWSCLSPTLAVVRPSRRCCCCCHRRSPRPPWAPSPLDLIRFRNSGSSDGKEHWADGRADRSSHLRGKEHNSREELLFKSLYKQVACRVFLNFLSLFVFNPLHSRYFAFMEELLLLTVLNMAKCHNRFRAYEYFYEALYMNVWNSPARA